MLDEIGIIFNMFCFGIVNFGLFQRLKSVFKKVLVGVDINVLVVGGFILVGGGFEKDCGNVEGVYYKVFSDWWNNIVILIIILEFKINIVVIGGIDFEYFFYCIKNYMRLFLDIVIWEFVVNDYK